MQVTYKLTVAVMEPNYGTAQTQRRTRSHLQFCSRFKKSLIKGRGNCFARDSHE